MDSASPSKKEDDRDSCSDTESDCSDDLSDVSEDEAMYVSLVEQLDRIQSVDATVLPELAKRVGLDHADEIRDYLAVDLSPELVATVESVASALAASEPEKATAAKNTLLGLVQQLEDLSSSSESDSAASFSLADIKPPTLPYPEPDYETRSSPASLERAGAGAGAGAEVGDTASLSDQGWLDACLDFEVLPESARPEVPSHYQRLADRLVMAVKSKWPDQASMEGTALADVQRQVSTLCDSTCSDALTFWALSAAFDSLFPVPADNTECWSNPPPAKELLRRSRVLNTHCQLKLKALLPRQARQYWLLQPVPSQGVAVDDLLPFWRSSFLEVPIRDVHGGFTTLSFGVGLVASPSSITLKPHKLSRRPPIVNFSPPPGPFLPASRTKKYDVVVPAVDLRSRSSLAVSTLQGVTSIVYKTPERVKEAAKSTNSKSPPTVDRPVLLSFHGLLWQRFIGLLDDPALATAFVRDSIVASSSIPDQDPGTGWDVKTATHVIDTPGKHLEGLETSGDKKLWGSFDRSRLTLSAAAGSVVLRCEGLAADPASELANKFSSPATAVLLALLVRWTVIQEAVCEDKKGGAPFRKLATAFLNHPPPSTCLGVVVSPHLHQLPMERWTIPAPNPSDQVFVSVFAAPAEGSIGTVITTAQSLHSHIHDVRSHAMRILSSLLFVVTGPDTEQRLDLYRVIHRDYSQARPARLKSWAVWMRGELETALHGVVKFDQDGSKTKVRFDKRCLVLFTWNEALHVCLRREIVKAYDRMKMPKTGKIAAGDWCSIRWSDRLLFSGRFVPPATLNTTDLRK